MAQRNFGWFGIFRLGLVQAALGSVVVLTTSTLNRVMVVELAFAAMVPGALVTLHHAMQLLRPRMGYGSDLGQRRTPWIVLGMAALAVGGLGAALAVTLMAANIMTLGLALAMVSYVLIGGGVSACGTSLLVLMAKRVAAPRRAAAATIVWMMMIAGFAITATMAGKLLDPFSSLRLVAVAAGISGIAFVVTLVAMWRLEGGEASVEDHDGGAVDLAAERSAFVTALRQVWGEPEARRFTLFVFVSMLAYSAQDLILEPFAGAVYGWTPGESTQLAGTQHAGVFAGMLLVAVVTSALKGTRLASLKGWVIGGCMASAVAMLGLVLAAVSESGAWPLEQNVFVLGVANGVFSIAAIASMMTLASRGRGGREGTRMGLWGAAQAIAFGTGGLLGTVLVDVTRWISGPAAGVPYACVFALEALGFVVATWLVLEAGFERRAAARPSPVSRSVLPARYLAESRS
jgi:BCD family chlorophyll transporter-like MFS transporter